MRSLPAWISNAMGSQYTRFVTPQDLLWFQSVREVTEKLHKNHAVSIAVVRPGGERLSLIAGHSPRRSRADSWFQENQAPGGRYVTQIVSLPAGSIAVLRRARPRCT